MNWIRNPDVAEGAGEWFRRDPRVMAEVEANGWFGLGPERDAEIIEDQY